METHAWCSMSQHSSPWQGSRWCCERQCCTRPAVFRLATPLAENLMMLWVSKVFEGPRGMTSMWDTWTILAWFRCTLNQKDVWVMPVFCSCSAKFHILLHCTALTDTKGHWQRMAKVISQVPCLGCLGLHAIEWVIRNIHIISHSYVQNPLW